MKFLLFMAILCPAEVFASELTDVREQLVRHQAVGAVPAAQLAPAIVRLSHSYHVDSHVVTAVLLQESRGRADAYNAVSRDYGIMQINHKTANSLGIGPACLNTWQCNLAYGVLILSKLSRTCQYNVGLRALSGNALQKCLSYEQKLAILD